MSNALIEAVRTIPGPALPQSPIIIQGSNAEIQQFNNPQINTMNVYATAEHGELFDVSIAISNEFYSLFVVSDDDIKAKSFVIGRDCSLTETVGVDAEISKRFRPLTPDAIKEIKTFPTIFASLNRNRCQTDDEHKATLGFVTVVDPTATNGIKISFQSFCNISQRLLNAMATDLGIRGAAMRNELCQPHWAIKQIDLVKKLKVADIRLPAPF